MNLRKIIFETNNKTKLNILDIELILAYVIKKSREFILTHPEYELTKLQIKNYELRIKERINGWSVAAIIGEKEFYGLKFKVDKNVLIPRPETEILVEEALKITNYPATAEPRHGGGELRITNSKIIVIDVGTGSGCIIITLAKLLNNESKIKNHELYGIDISNKVLNIAKKNAKLHSVNMNIKFFNGNLLDPILKNTKYQIPNTKYLILANLPYLTPAQIKNSPSIQKEPSLALVAGHDGLKYYRQLFQQIKKLRFVIPQSKFSLICEIDPAQKIIFSKIFKQFLFQEKLIFKRDLSQKIRLAIIN